MKPANLKLGPTSLTRLRGVHPDLVAVVHAADEALPFRILVVEGVRTQERQDELYAQGRTRPGKIVTWTRRSRHTPGADGFGKAVDLAPLDDRGVIDWNNREAFNTIARQMFAAAAARGVDIRWGADWDRDGIPWEPGEYDGPHFELDSKRYP
jgi:peptidoglycan L-alanyl-D-glutamate endopeptidase CwlK